MNKEFEGTASHNEMMQGSGWSNRVPAQGNTNAEFEDGSSSSHGHYMTKSEVDTSDASSDEQQSFGNGFDLRKTPESSNTSGGGRSNLPIRTSQGPDGQIYITSADASTLLSGNISGQTIEEAFRKRELRLQKNKEAAKECRRKKKEYVKCLENRVMVLEAQNRTLIDELKALKELYCKSNKH